MPTVPLQIRDFWRVNGYGYPNPFNPETNSQEAWATLCSFRDWENRSYKSLKEFWDSSQAPRKLTSKAVESWKAAFEEFGLLYVITRSDIVTVTPAGKQFLTAAEGHNEQDLIWVGLNLLFRYPLHGPPRARGRTTAHRESDVLPYRFLHSAMRDLGDYFWWTEMERIFCRVFSTSEAKPAVDAVREIRSDPSRLSDYPRPSDKRQGAFYNSLNQVAVHGGMNHTLFTQDAESEHYGASEPRRRQFINRQYLSLVSAALGDAATVADCGASAMYVDRLPAAPSFTDEQKYFDYLGAPVPAPSVADGSTLPQAITLAGDTVFILKAGEHIEQISASTLERRVKGDTRILCRVARNHRVILSTDRKWTYLVDGKNLVGSNTVELLLRRARPITNMEPIEILFGGENA